MMRVFFSEPRLKLAASQDHDHHSSTHAHKDGDCPCPCDSHGHGGKKETKLVERKLAVEALEVADKKFNELGFPSAEAIQRNDGLELPSFENLSKFVLGYGSMLLKTINPLPCDGVRIMRKTGGGSRFEKFRQENMVYLSEKRDSLGLDTSKLSSTSSFSYQDVFKASDPDKKGIDSLLRSLPCEDMKAKIGRDIVTLMKDFAEVGNIQNVKVKFELKRKQTCPRYHVDNVPYRLLVTYKGPGTDYLTKGYSNPMLVPNKSVVQGPNWDVLGIYRMFIVRRISHDGYNKLAVLPGAEFSSSEPGEIIILKGAAWNGCEGALHRSPPLNNGDLRLVVTMDVAQER
eukprot:jgi/Bigna1/130567/aug1.11_g5275